MVFIADIGVVGFNVGREICEKWRFCIVET